MKKSILFVFAAASLGFTLTSCDPEVDDSHFSGANPTSADELLKGATFKQCKQVTDESGAVTGYEESSDGNYIFYNIPSVNSVEVFNYLADGSEFDLSKNTGDKSYASGGLFELTPARGSSSEQTAYFRYINAEGDTVIASKDFTVAVPADISAELKLLTSNASSTKTWTWDTSLNGGGWGNAGYAGGGTGAEFAAAGGGTWWACAPADLSGQMAHAVEADKDNAAKDADPAATMVFDENGTVKCYDANGNQYRSGSFSISGWNGGEYSSTYSSDGATEFPLMTQGTLKTSEGAILWPYEINAGGKYVTEYEIALLDYDHLVLVYPDGNSRGSWGECAWWRFKNISDGVGKICEDSQAKWTWDTDLNGGGWGNAGALADSDAPGEKFANEGTGTWWACAPADLAGQLSHAVGGVATGAEDPGAYMIFESTGLVTSYKADGSKISSATWEVQNYNANRDVNNWSMGTLHTGENSILWPFEINAGGKYVTDFQIIGLTSDKMVLAYPDGGSLAAWGECSWWRFKKVK